MVTMKGSGLNNYLAYQNERQIQARSPLPERFYSLGVDGRDPFFNSRARLREVNHL
jgi:hypothetical protein